MKSEGMELGDEELEAINGGMVSGWSIPGCPKFDGYTKRVKYYDTSLNVIGISGRGADCHDEPILILGEFGTIC